MQVIERKLSTQRRSWTRHELLTLNDYGRYELVRGRLQRKHRTNYTYSSQLSYLIQALYSYNRAYQRGEVIVGDTCCELQSIPLTIRTPLVTFVSAERRPKMYHHPALLPIAPDLSIDVISPVETDRSLGERVSDYLLAGTRLLWLIHPEQCAVDEWHQGAQRRTYRPGDQLDGHDVLPGFSYSVKALFT